MKSWSHCRPLAKQVFGTRLLLIEISEVVNSEHLFVYIMEATLWWFFNDSVSLYCYCMSLNCKLSWVQRLVWGKTGPTICQHCDDGGKFSWDWVGVWSICVPAGTARYVCTYLQGCIGWKIRIKCTGIVAYADRRKSAMCLTRSMAS